MKDCEPALKSESNGQQFDLLQERFKWGKVRTGAYSLKNERSSQGFPLMSGGPYISCSI